MAVKFIPNAKGIRAMLRDPKVLVDLQRRAQKVAAAASRDDLTYEVRSEIGEHRARAAVIAAGARTNAHEHRHHDLAHYIDVARD